MANGAFIPGTGTLKSTNLMNAFLELAMLTQTQERIALGNSATLTANNLTVPDFITITANYNTDTMTVSIPQLPIALSIVGGNISITAVDYLAPINAVVPGVNHSLDVTDSDLTSTSKVKGLLELAQKIQADEQGSGQNRVTMTINTDTNVASISATFPGTPSVNANGKIEFNATNYLAV